MLHFIHCARETVMATEYSREKLDNSQDLFGRGRTKAQYYYCWTLWERGMYQLLATLLDDSVMNDPTHVAWLEILPIANSPSMKMAGRSIIPYTEKENKAAIKMIETALFTTSTKGVGHEVMQQGRQTPVTVSRSWFL